MPSMRPGIGSAKSSSVTVATAACGDAQAPSVPGSLRSTATAGSVSLSWSASSDNVGAPGYGVYRGGSSVGSTSSTSYTVTGLSCGTSYSLSVDAFDAAGNRSAKSSSVTVATAACSSGDVEAPSVPGSLQSTGRRPALRRCPGLHRRTTSVCRDTASIRVALMQRPVSTSSTSCTGSVGSSCGKCPTRCRSTPSMRLGNRSAKSSSVSVSTAALPKRRRFELAR